MKKYKLKVPDLIRKENAPTAIIVKEWQVVTKAEVERVGIPPDWLEEIKDEPMSDSESINNAIRELESVFGSYAHGFRSEVWSIIEKVIHNERSRYKPRQTFE